MNPVTASLAEWIENATRYMFFTGKGGVGKTTLSCTVAVGLADLGKRVLLISTDPASNLSEVLGQKLTTVATELSAVPGLHALNIDPLEAAREYRERILTPYRGVMPEAMIAGMEEQLSGACTTEIASFSEFSRFLGDEHSTAGFEHVIFDTAPTGHTLRLLQLPAAWNGFLDVNTSGTSCLGPLAGLARQRELYARVLETLQDSSRTMVGLVTRPERTAMVEAERSGGELQAIGLGNIHLLVNGIFKGPGNDPVAEAMMMRQQQALQDMPAGLQHWPCVFVPLRSFHVVGIEHLRAMREEPSAECVPADVQKNKEESAQWPGLTPLIEQFEAVGSGVILVMGKGGVGKTTVAASIAVELASRGYATHLTTTDPAAHVQLVLNETVENLTLSRIDPAREVENYSRQVLATAGAQLDAEGRKLLEEDLRSPCTEEIAIFHAFAKILAEGLERFVVLDTAPTGHTLLLLDASEAYHRQISRTQNDLPDAVRNLLPRLRDQQFSRILLVTLPEATPVHEAIQLQSDLERAGITPFAWVMNQSLHSLKIQDPLLQTRQHNESRYVDEVQQRAERLAVIPWQAVEPVGVDRLRQLAAGSNDQKLTTNQRQTVTGLPRVLFLCTGNSCRSQMGEAWCRHLLGGKVDAYSAGIETHGLNPRMLTVMKEAGVDTSALRSKHLDELADIPFDLVVTVCDHAAETCPIFPGAKKVVHRPFADPPGLTRGMEDEDEILTIYRRVRDEIGGFVEKELLKTI